MRLVFGIMRVLKGVEATTQLLSTVTTTFLATSGCGKFRTLSLPCGSVTTFVVG